MKIYIYMTILVFSIFGNIFAEETFKLRDGTIVSGSILNETDTEVEVLTKFGLIKINKSLIIKTQYKVKLNSGETFVGEIINENPLGIILKTKMGDLNLPNSDILNIEETLDPKEKGADGIDSILKESEFALGEEQLTDLFFDPTGYTLKKGTFYLSGLSFGFGVSDNFDITTKWFNYFWGDLNFRPKYKLFEKGNWEKQQSLSIGAHFHVQDASWNRYVWKEGNINIYEYTGEYVVSGVDCGISDDGDEEVCWKQTGPRTQSSKYWGGYYKIGVNPEIDEYDPQEPVGYDPNAIDVYYSEEPSHRSDNWVNTNEEYMTTLEIFTAYTFSKARNNDRTNGRISHTFGLSTTFYSDIEDTKLIYRGYYGLDLDINKKMKMISEIFYDPSFIDPWDKDDGLFGGFYSNNELQDTPVKEDKIFPIHLDFGFMYAFNESFRCGIHFQAPVVAFYWKF